MSENKKEEVKQISPFIETRNLDLKEELHKKLEEFASTTDNLEEIFENREQIEISKYYEKMPKPTLVALNEFMTDQLYSRNKDQE